MKKSKSLVKKYLALNNIYRLKRHDIVELCEKLNNDLNDLDSNHSSLIENCTKLIKKSTLKQVRVGDRIKNNGELCFVYKIVSPKKGADIDSPLGMIGLEPKSGMSYEFDEPEYINCFWSE